MKSSSLVVWISILIAVLAAVAAGYGLFWQNGGSPSSFTSVHGQTVEIFGQGIYASDTVFNAGTYKGSDLLTLIVFIPALIVSLLVYRRGSLRGAFLLTGVLSVFLYNGASMAFGAAYNNLFLVYTALLGLSFFAFVLAFTSIDLKSLSRHISRRLPARGIAVFLFIAGLAPLALWLGDVLGALSQGRVPELLGSYTTMFTYAIDLGIIVPVVYLAGVLVLRRTPLGILLAFVMLVLLTAVGFGAVSSTFFQLNLGITFSPGQFIGLIGSWLILGLIAIGFNASILKNIMQPETL